MNPTALSLSVLLLLIILIGLAYTGRQILRERRRTRTLEALLDNADRLESDLKECRQRLNQAHAVMSLSPTTPSANENEARQAVDSGLRSLLQHRLWIRDHAETATQKQLDEAVDALKQARRQMEPQLAALGRAQRDLDQAVRDRIERDKLQ
ncbi:MULTISPECIES: hypothetical protein [Oleiagrimonas]|uniref:Uncharacterized protein n=1 Tax=Oleiagrimonas citrea TaxID=1665687 RepID=A0A846ZIP7_9GAMM|nr:MULTISPECIES: hypothetical protein [Oleiagrimonas]NKZ37692.1 hypothetical protein [Oleiagrimonas citrea]RAP56461.1 hypothetical protein BTJ49_13270 [Oleiagrimonas sp. MCCC 1A03011]